MKHDDESGPSREPIIFVDGQQRRPVRRRGRRRVRGVLPFSHYEGSGDGHRPYCKARGCKTPLHRGQHAACSEECLRAILEYVETLWLAAHTQGEAMRIAELQRLYPLPRKIRHRKERRTDLRGCKS
jgi:hypothetical protein